MISINDKELFEKYYQTKYDFNTSSLTQDEVDEIKQFVKEKRVDYALAPIGVNIFEWVIDNNPNIKFEYIDFDSNEIDGMLYIPESGSESAYIILNSNRSLINQIFTTAHEYYHYHKDYATIKKNPYICNFSELKNVNEKKASRFAAEFLLPDMALKKEMHNFKKKLNEVGINNLSFEEYAAIALNLTIKYQLPLKAVIYRLYEEKYISDIKTYIDNYDFIKSILYEINLITNDVEKLYSNENPYIKIDRMIYKKMESAYNAGYASKEMILSDAKILGLDEKILFEFIAENIEDEDDDIDEDILLELCKAWGDD